MEPTNGKPDTANWGCKVWKREDLERKFQKENQFQFAHQIKEEIQ